MVQECFYKLGERVVKFHWLLEHIRKNPGFAKRLRKDYEWEMMCFPGVAREILLMRKCIDEFGRLDYAKIVERYDRDVAWMLQLDAEFDAREAARKGGILQQISKIADKETKEGAK